MIITFVPKYGENHIEFALANGDIIRANFIAKYGKNRVELSTNPVTAIEFNLKYGKNTIEIEIPDETVIAEKKGFFADKVTIYNDITSDGVNPRQFHRFVIDKCNIQKGILQNTDGTIEKVVNGITIITKDVKHYKTPLVYSLLPADVKDSYFTANVNDFVVLAEVDDVVTTPTEFKELQRKYKNNGFSVTAVNEYIHGMAVDNVQIIHA